MNEFEVFELNSSIARLIKTGDSSMIADPLRLAAVETGGFTTSSSMKEEEQTE